MPSASEEKPCTHFPQRRLSARVKVASDVCKHLRRLGRSILASKACMLSELGTTGLHLDGRAAWHVYG